MQRNQQAFIQRASIIFLLILGVGFAFSQAVWPSGNDSAEPANANSKAISDVEISSLLNSSSIAESSNWLDDAQETQPSRVSAINEVDDQTSAAQETSFSSSFTETLEAKDDNVLFSKRSN